MKKAVVLTCDDNYAPFACITARRILRNAREPIKVMIVCLNLREETRAKVAGFCPEVDLVDAAAFAGYRPAANSVVSTPYYLRLFLDEMLQDFGHVVYLDCDVSLLTDVSPLLSLRHVSAPIIAAHDPFVELEIDNRASLGMSPDAPYLNSGVMVLDMKGIREEGIFAAARAFAELNPRACSMADQDALNAVLDGRWQTLDWRWNVMSHLADLMTKGPFIRHFAGNKPWAKDKHGVEPRFVSEWRADFKQSPWPGLFHEQSLNERIRAAVREPSRSVEVWVKDKLFADTDSRRGQRASLARQMPHALAAIEEAAKAGHLACRSPQTTLFGRADLTPH